MHAITCTFGAMDTTFLHVGRKQSSQSAEKGDKGDIQREAEMRDRGGRYQASEHF